MTTIDGGPAFPVECCYNGEGKIVGLQTSAAGGWETGMTLRDYFAGKSLVAIAGLWKGNIGDFDNEAADRTAKAAYRMADAMIAARSPQDTEHPTASSPAGSAPSRRLPE